MSGTALTEAEEMATIYKLKVLAVPPVLPVQRVDLPNAVYKNVKGKSNAALNELMGMHKAGAPSSSVLPPSRGRRPFPTSCARSA